MEKIEINKERNSSFELLRIISMLMIIFHHFAVHGGFIIDKSSLTVNNVWYYIMLNWGKIGVNIFVLISGYFLITDKGPLFNLKKMLRFLGPIILYSVVIYLVYSIANNNFNIIHFIDNLTPVISNKWWFITTYVLLFLFHPFLNMVLNKINKSTYQIIMLALVLIWSVIPTFTDKRLYVNEFLWFITLYVIAGYIRLYDFNPKFKCRHYMSLWLLSMIVTIGWTIVCLSFYKYNNKVFSTPTFFFSLNTLTCLLNALMLFMAFKTIKMKNNKIINTIASTTLAVYLVHDSDYVRRFLWIKLFKNNTFINSLWFIPYSIMVCFLVFIVISIIDLIRIKTIHKVYVKSIEKWSPAIAKACGKIYKPIRNCLFGKDVE